MTQLHMNFTFLQLTVTLLAIASTDVFRLQNTTKTQITSKLKTCLSIQLVGHGNPIQAHSEPYGFEEAAAERE